MGDKNSNSLLLHRSNTISTTDSSGYKKNAWNNILSKFKKKVKSQFSQPEQVPNQPFSSANQTLQNEAQSIPSLSTSSTGSLNNLSESSSLAANNDLAQTMSLSSLDASTLGKKTSQKLQSKLKHRTNHQIVDILNLASGHFQEGNPSLAAEKFWYCLFYLDKKVPCQGKVFIINSDQTVYFYGKAFPNKIVRFSFSVHEIIYVKEISEISLKIVLRNNNTDVFLTNFVGGTSSFRKELESEILNASNEYSNAGETFWQYFGRTISLGESAACKCSFISCIKRKFKLASKSNDAQNIFLCKYCDSHFSDNLIHNEILSMDMKYLFELVSSPDNPFLSVINESVGLTLIKCPEWKLTALLAGDQAKWRRSINFRFDDPELFQTSSFLQLHQELVHLSNDSIVLSCTLSFVKAPESYSVHTSSGIWDQIFIFRYCFCQVTLNETYFNVCMELNQNVSSSASKQLIEIVHTYFQSLINGLRIKLGNASTQQSVILCKPDFAPLLFNAQYFLLLKVAPIFKEGSFLVVYLLCFVLMLHYLIS